MFHYAVISIHPKTHSVTHRSYHQTHQEAISSLKDEVANFITNYKRYQTVMYINHIEDIEKHPKIKYFLRIPDEMPDRIEVYERIKKVSKGYVYNSSYYESVLIKIFDVVSTNMPSKDGSFTCGSQASSDYQWAEKLNADTQESQQANLNQVALMEELSKKVLKHKERMKYD